MEEVNHTGYAAVMTTDTGRRARKKQLTRQAISDVATELFLERGFDPVTVAEVAAAADVAVQTVFNHFPTKEDLFFDQTGWWTGPAEAVRVAPTGEPVVHSLRRHYLTAVEQRLESGQLATWGRFWRTIDASPALLSRQRRDAQQMEDLLVDALRDRPQPVPQLNARLIAAQYAAAQKVLELELARLLPEEAGAAESARATAKLQEAINEVFGMLARGFGEV